MSVEEQWNLGRVLRCRMKEGSDLCMRQTEGDKQWPESGLPPTRGLELKPYAGRAARRLLRYTG